MSAVTSVSRSFNAAIRPLGIRVTRTDRVGDPKEFLPLEKTLAAAADAGLSVADYVDSTFNVRGATQQTIDRLTALGVFASPSPAVVEIGPGSGRYLEKIVRMTSPSRYEIYETADAWAEYLEHTYNVIRQSADGLHLSSTPDGSADLVQAHKVFVITPFVTTCTYWDEMLRVARPGGHIVFDVVTEACMDRKTLERWQSANIFYGNYPAIVPRQFALDFFEERGAHVLGSFKNPMQPGFTEVFAFRKN